MDDANIKRIPSVIDPIERDTREIGFTMGSEPRTGSLLRTLAASKPAGRFLELGTGTGIGTAWLLAGMDAHSKLDSVDRDPSVQEIARRHLGYDYNPHDPSILNFPNKAPLIDNGTYRGALQDLGFAVRYNVTTKPVSTS